jgi:hypothetical protein
MIRRNSDGSFGTEAGSSGPTNRSQIARWVEEEVPALKLLGLSFSEIAVRIGRAGRHEITAAVLLPAVNFPANYRISETAVHKAWQRVNRRRAKLTVSESIELDVERIEQLILNLQRSIHADKMNAYDIELRCLKHKASILCYSSVKLEVTAEVTVEKHDPQTCPDCFPIEIMRELTDDEHEVVYEIMGNARKRFLDKEAAKRQQPKPPQ